MARDWMKDLAQEFDSLESCCMHEAQWHPRDVADVIAWRDESPEGYGSTDQVILVELKDRAGFGMLTSWSDTTGHGCRCDSYTVRADSLSALTGRMTDDELRELLRDRKDGEDS